MSGTRQDHVVQQFKFKLRLPVPGDDLIAAGESFGAWLKEQPGFLTHHVYYDAIGDNYTFKVFWESIAAAELAWVMAKSSSECAWMFENAYSAIARTVSTALIFTMPTAQRCGVALRANEGYSVTA